MGDLQTDAGESLELRYVPFSEFVRLRAAGAPAVATARAFAALARIHVLYVHANTGSLGMGISKAKGIAIANRIAGAPRRVFVLTGDGELQEGQFWESLGSAARMRLGEIVAVIDHNKIQSDTWVERVSGL